MLKDGQYPLPSDADAFPGRLREALESYGSTSAVAKAISRSEGAVRKWLHGKSQPNVSDLRAICVLTNTNVEWLVFGRGNREGDDSRQVHPLYEDGELPPVHFKLMDEVVAAVKLEPTIGGVAVTQAKCSSILTSVYNLSRFKRQVDPESAQRIAALAS